jgi:hypothetical protein
MGDLRLRAILATVVALAGGARVADAWDPGALAGGRLRIGGEASFSMAAEDRGFFNYTDYQDSYLRMARLGAAAEVRLTSHLALLGELRTYNFRDVRPYALYARIRPWASRELDVQVGRIPPVFGAFPRRRYATDNPLIGLPQAYQYLTSVRTDALPANADDLERMRGEGWLVRYPLGNRLPAAGMPLVALLEWDTGVQVRVGSEPVEVSAAVTQGTLGSPRFEDDNDGKQFAARIALRPLAGLVLGASGARGEYLARSAQEVLSPELAAREYRQKAWGADLEYSRGYWLLRAEAIWCDWDMPAVRAPLVTSPLRSRAYMLEGRYKVAPGAWVAARFDHLGFSDVPASAGPITWDAPVDRLEIGGGYQIQRYLILKASWQRNRRDGGKVLKQDFLAAQVLLWF